MRAADECHPLPDQLHPCSSFFRFSAQSALRQFKEPKRSMRFTTPSIASAGDPVFAREKCSFPRPGVPSLLSLRHPSRLPAPPFRVAVGFSRAKPRPVFSSSREGDAKMSNPKRVPPMRARALELSSQARFCRRTGEETVSFSRRSFRPRSSCEVLTPNLPRRDELSPTRPMLRSSSESQIRASFSTGSPKGVAEERSKTAKPSTSATES
jgi:hypothetical protein